MSTAIINLLKSFFARPAKPQSQTLHWVRADKPFDEMSPNERKHFSTNLANEIFSQNKILQPPSEKKNV